MNFSDLTNRVAGEVGLDATADATVLGTWINAAYKQINGLFNWPWLFAQGAIQTVADITTGTVSINSGSTALTFSSAPTISVAAQFMLQIPSVSNDWYFITAHTANQTNATIAVPFVGSVNVSGVAYIVRKVLYSLPSDLDRIIDLRQAVTYSKLGAVDIRTFDRYLPNPTATGSPLYYSLVGTDSSGYWQVSLYPTPSIIENIQIRYLKIPADMSGTNTPIIPEKFHPLIVYGALYMFGHAYIDDTRYNLAKDRYEELFNEMLMNYNPIPDQMLVVQPWDTRPRRLVGRLMWPPNFPENWR